MATNSGERLAAIKTVAAIVIQIIAAGMMAAYVISYLDIRSTSFFWTLTISVGVYALSFGIVEIIVIYFREVVTASPHDLGKQRARRRWRLVKYAVVLVAVGGAVAVLQLVSVGGRPLFDHVLEYILRDDTRYVRRTLREIFDLSPDYSVKLAAVNAIAATKSPEAIYDLLRIGNATEGSYEDPKGLRENEFFCGLAEAIGSFRYQAAALVVGEYSSRRDRKPAWSPRIPELARRFASYFKQLRTEIVETVKGPEVSRPLEQELLAIESDLAKKLNQVEGRYLAELKTKQTYKRNYIDLLLDGLRNIKFSRESDAVYGMAREIAFDDDFPPETRRRALILFAEHGSLRDIPILSNMAKTDKTELLRVTATQSLPLLGKKVFGEQESKETRTWYLRDRCD